MWQALGKHSCLLCHLAASHHHKRPQHCTGIGWNWDRNSIRHKYSNALTQGQENIYNVKKKNSKKGEKIQNPEFILPKKVTFNILFNWKEKGLEGRKWKEEMKEGGKKQEGAEERKLY